MFRKIVKKFFTILNKILYRVEYINLDKLPNNGPAILASNHQHTFDVSVIHCASKPWVYWVAKKELTDTPFFGKLIAKMGVLPVDRKRHDLSVAKGMFDLIKRKEVIGIFPQGTRMKNSRDISETIPKVGAVHFALKTDTPIIPIGINGTYKLFSKIKVVVGDPIDFTQMPKNIQGDSDMLKKGIYLMTKIYELVGIEYKINESKITSEKENL